MVKRALLAVALVAAVVLPVQAQAGAAAPAQHCVVHVTGQKASGEMTLSAPRCYSTFAAAMSGEHVVAWGAGASTRAAASGAALADFVLATHYDLPNFNGSGGSTSTVGSGCTGGWLNTSASWNNRIGSTANGCPSVVHYDFANLLGTSKTTTGIGGNLGTMDNRTSSIQYT
jgi:hypothetical protein